MVRKDSLADRRSEGPNGRIEKKVWIRASAEVVYKALTDSKELAHWFCDRANCDPREGGELIASWKSGQKGRAVFKSAVPNTMLELVWIDDGCGTRTGDLKHTLRYEIRATSFQTEVLMLDRDEQAPDKETITFLDQGWNAVLTELKDYCERRERSAKLRPARERKKAQSVE
jgi:uncharacterized protein YndB with AHSA1/START domain